MTNTPPLLALDELRTNRRSSPQMRAVDFFCGAGGMTHGLLSAGVDVLGGIDNHAPCRETYEHEKNNRRPNQEAPKFIHADVAELEPSHLEEQLGIVENDDSLLLAGCSPCQYWSKVNTDRNKSSRSKSLLQHFQRFVEAFRPGYVVVENVPGLQTRAESSGLSSFLEFLEESGYAFAQGKVPLYRYGVPQKRFRYLLLATRALGTDEAPFALPPAESSEKPFPEDMKLKHHIGIDAGFPPLKAGERCDSPSLHWAANLASQNLERLRRTPKNGGSREAWKDDPNLQIDAYRGKDDIFRDVYGRMSWDEPAPTITTRFNSLSNGRFGHPEEDRAISLREGATLQTFPKTYVFPRNFPETARQIGNAVPPELARRIGCHLLEHHRAVAADVACG